MYDGAVQSSFLVIGWIGLCVYGIGIFLLYLKRRVQPVRSKDVFWLYFMSVMFLLLNSFAAFYHQEVFGVDTYDCAVVVMQAMFPYLTWITVACMFTLRLWSMYVKFCIAEEHHEAFDMFAKFARTSKSDVLGVTDKIISSSKGWYRRHQWLVSKPFSILIVLLSIFITFGLSAYFDAVPLTEQCSALAGNRPQAPSFARAYGYVVLFTLFVFVNGLTAYRIAKDDTYAQFGLLTEYFLVGVFSLLYCIVMVTKHLTVDQTKLTGWKKAALYEDFVSVGYLFVIYAVMVISPLFQAFFGVRFEDADEDRLKPYVEHLAQLDTVLSTNSGFQTFRAFLTLEQELHKLLFVESVRAYKSTVAGILKDKKSSPRTKQVAILNNAFNLHHDFLSKGCPLLKDVPDVAVQRIANSIPKASQVEIEDSKEDSRSESTSRFAEPKRPTAFTATEDTIIFIKDSSSQNQPAEVFDEVFTLILDDLNNNTFSKFRQSLLFQELELDARRNTIWRKALVDLNIM